ncbi:hypothetical protein DPMN_087100 [Dreissena polymorpha]|uniref:Uncharacterized protein n=1 Tax=Dreissena polymorpha TaxID=45954 RepID=A0A9D4I6Z4_DREPO|nr:hypothetical protein DPMN_183391 [Dreissena polymorpha]KAH3844836.1 hypothetical protein DPMN_087100 [Dreissena polymorpha]
MSNQIKSLSLGQRLQTRAEIIHHRLHRRRYSKDRTLQSRCFQNDHMLQSRCYHNDHRDQGESQIGMEIGFNQSQLM